VEDFVCARRKDAVLDVRKPASAKQKKKAKGLFISLPPPSD
jgi:hypothetical protein